MTGKQDTAAQSTFLSLAAEPVVLTILGTSAPSGVPAANWQSN